MKTSEALGVLNLPSDATPEQIRKAYFRLVRVCSPEKDPERFQRIREAYELLRDHREEPAPDSSLTYPSDPGVCMLIHSAEEYRNAGRYTKAAALLEQAIRLAPDEPVPLFEIILTYLDDGKSQKAAAKAERLVQICPENQSAWWLYAKALFDRGWHKKAMPAFRRTCELGEIENDSFMTAYLQTAFMNGCLEEGNRIARKMLEREKWEEEETFFPIEALNCMVTYQMLQQEELREYLDMYLTFLRNNRRVLRDIPDLMSPLFGLLHRQIEEKEATRESCQMMVTAGDEVARLFPDAAEEVRHFQFVTINQTLAQDRKLTLDIWQAMAKAAANDEHAGADMVRYQKTDAELALVMEWETARKELPDVRKAYPMLYAEYAGFLEKLASGKQEKVRREIQWEYDKQHRRFNGGIVEEWYGGRKPEEPEELFSSQFSPQNPFVRDQPKVGRNDPCPCGSGRKFKQCCIGKGLYD